MNSQLVTLLSSLSRRSFPLAATLLAFVFTANAASLAAAEEEQPAAEAKQEAKKPQPKQVIGAIAEVAETQSEFSFIARVDTGATTSSLHVEEWVIKDEAEAMTENLGKKIRFLITSQNGKKKWLERKIAEISVIKTSEQEETRYKVPVTLDYNGVQKKVLVSLNDRSHMKYPMLLGRNYLQGDFLVDVDLGE